MPGGRKTTYVIGGKGLKPDTNYRNVSSGKFTKKSRLRKAPPGVDLREHLRRVYDYPA